MLVLLGSSCSRRLGYGVLLWSSDDPSIPSGTVLPVFIRSNIERIWVAGIPDEFRESGSRIDKFEIPLPQLELVGSRRQARRWADDFSPYALIYAETLQDGLPIRESPSNTSRRVYRLRIGEVIKVLRPVEGVAAVGATGDPLPGEWLRVMTEGGTIGYCFSYRLRVFEHVRGEMSIQGPIEWIAEDPELERLLSRVWVSESYSTMINTQRLDMDELMENWGFDPGQDIGYARIRTRDVDRSFSYNAIRPTGTRSWRFDGSELQMSLRSDTTLAVQFIETSGLYRTVLFVTLPTSVEDLIDQEFIRREGLYNNLYYGGPQFSSNNYGTITFLEDGRFTWTGFNLLTPQIIPGAALGSGVVDMRLFLASSLTDWYNGALTLRFNGLSGERANVDFLYSLDSQGLRLEHVPDTSLDGNIVSRRALSPLVLFFYRDGQPGFSDFGYSFDDDFSFDLDLPNLSSSDFFNFWD